MKKEDGQHLLGEGQNWSDLLMPDQPDISPTRAQLQVLKNMLEGQPIDPCVIEAVLATTNTINHNLVKQNLDSWNEMAGHFNFHSPFHKNKMRHMSTDNFIVAVSFDNFDTALLRASVLKGMYDELIDPSRQA